MSVIGDALLSGGFDTGIIKAFLWGRGTSTSYTTMGDLESYDPSYVSISSHEYTFLKGGDYNLTYFGRGGYNSSGTAINLQFRIQLRRNGETTSIASSTTVANGGVVETIQQTFEVGDVLYVQARNSTGANTHDIGFIVTVPTE